MPAWIVGDTERLRQVVVNLVANAVKFTERGAVHVSIRNATAAADSRPGSAVALEFGVTDTGIGIPAAQQALLFRPFSQVDGSIARRHGGTGLGLAICKGLVTAMGGRIWVLSEAGAGASFHFTLPTEVAAPPVAAPAEAGSPFDDTLAQRLPLRILLAEDNEVNQKVALAMLRRFGYRADIAANGLEALAAVRRQRYDLVLMDIQMPDMDGLAATRAMLALGLADQMPRIIGLSANALSGDVDAATRAGMDDYLPKPMSPTQLRAMIEKWGQRLSP